MVRALSVAGAAGALSAFLGAPLVGAVFALELCAGPSCGWGGPAAAHSPAVAASVAGALVAALAAHLGGGPLVHVGAAYATMAPRPWPGHLLAPAFLLGAGTGLLSTALTALVRAGRRATVAVAAEAAAAPVPPMATAALRDRARSPSPPPHRWRRVLAPVLVPAAAGLCVGGLGVLWPQTLLWGETRLGALLANAPACGTIHAGLAARAVVSGGGFAALGASGALQVALAKLAAIALAAAAGLPGGVIFPLFFAGAALAQSFAACALPPGLLPLAAVCAMAGLQAATTRTPLASVLMLAGSAAAASIDMADALPFAATSAYAAVWTAQWTRVSFFEYPVVEEEKGGAFKKTTS